MLRDAVLQTYIPCLHLSFGEIIGEGKFLVSLRDIFFYTSFTYIFFPHKEPLFFAFNFVYLMAPLPQWADLISVARRMPDKYILEMYVTSVCFSPPGHFGTVYLARFIHGGSECGDDKIAVKILKGRSLYTLLLNECDSYS